jgi:hypothetical protein
LQKLFLVRTRCVNTSTGEMVLISATCFLFGCMARGFCDRLETAIRCPACLFPVIPPWPSTKEGPGSGTKRSPRR